jgi:hypothetical protein
MLAILLVAARPGATRRDPARWRRRLRSAQAAPAGGARLAAAAQAGALGAVPRPDHIVMVIEENHSGAWIIGNPDAS